MLRAAARRRDTQIAISAEGDETFIDVRSRVGIDVATIARVTDKWPPKISVRLHLGGLESLKASAGNITVEWSVSSTGDHASRVTLWQNNQESAIISNNVFGKPST